MKENENVLETENNQCKISMIQYKKDIVRIRVSSNDADTLYKISLNDFLELGYKKGDILMRSEMNYLCQRHLYHFAYEKCIRKLSASDKTEKEIRTLLNEFKDLGADEKDEIIENLKETGFLSDEAVVESQFYMDQNKMLGRNKTRFTLKNRGANSELVDEFLSKTADEEEIKRGVEKAIKLFEKASKKSFKEKEQYVRNRLIADGYESIDEIIEKCNCKKNEDEEKDALRITAEKICKKYKLKYSGKQLYFNNYKYLISKGYDSDTIKSVLQDMEVKDED